MSNKEERKHAIFSPSSAHRLLRCPGSAVYDIAIPSTESEYAREGTFAHAVAAYCLQEEISVKDVVGKQIEVEYGDGVVMETVPADMVQPLQHYIDGCLKGKEDADMLFIEEKVDLNDVYMIRINDEPSSGTCDFAMYISKTKHLRVRDLKYGRGEAVSAEKNEQEMIYAAGIVKQLEGVYGENAVQKITLEICQPRIADGDSEYDMTIDELNQFVASLNAPRPTMDKSPIEIVDYIYRNFKPANFEVSPTWFCPGDKQCRFCKGNDRDKSKVMCPFLKQHLEEQIDACFEDVTAIEKIGKSVPDVSDEDLAKMLHSFKLLSKFIEVGWAEANRRMVEGKILPGWKLIAGRKGARSWTSDGDAEARLKGMRLKIEDMYDLKVKSPTQMEKYFTKEKPSKRRWKSLQEYIEQKDGKPQIALESHKAPALEFKPVDDAFIDHESAPPAGEIAEQLPDELQEFC